MIEQQRQNVPANLTADLRDNAVKNLPALRNFVQTSVANASLPDGFDLQTLLEALPNEEDIPDSETINTGIQAVVDNIPEDAVEVAGNLLTNL